MASFKSDQSFLEKISIGAIGTRKVFEDLVRQGHTPIELERGSMNYKIWKKIKIKRIRVPDILLINCGIRIESRAKTKLEITMSHSMSDPERGWDYGMKNNDFVALVVCEKDGDRPIDWKADELVQYVSIQDLRKALANDQVDFVKPKGAEEGFEARITWVATVASANGTIKQITDERIQFTRETDNRTISLSLTKKKIKMTPLVEQGEKILKNQIIASVVPVSQQMNFKQVGQRFFLNNLTSTALSERYASAKALSNFHSKEVEAALLKKISDQDEHIYVKLEAAASLARSQHDAGYDFIRNCLKDAYVQNILESVIVLAEIETDKSCQLLCEVLQDENQDPEIRAGAAFGLGELNNKVSLMALVSSFNTVEERIKAEAARALAKMTDNFSGDILDKFKDASPVEKPGLAWALVRSKDLALNDLIKSLKDLESRQWISYIVGSQGEKRYIEEIEQLKERDPEIYFAVTVLWKIMTSWVFELKEY